MPVKYEFFSRKICILPVKRQSARILPLTHLSHTAPSKQSAPYLITGLLAWADTSVWLCYGTTLNDLIAFYEQASSRTS